MSEAPIQVRPAGIQDLPVLAALHAACFPDDPWDQTALARLLAMHGCFALLIQQDAQPCGFALTQFIEKQGEILSLGIVPPSRRTGLGRSVVDEICRIAAEAGIQSLHLEVAVDNDAARRLYRAAGFREAGRRKHYYRRSDALAADALVLKRTLQPCAGLNAG